MNPPSYAQVVGVSSSPESHRNAVRVNTFAHGDGKDMRSIKHIFFFSEPF